MLLLVGLGNPGSEYERHRHNVGFMAADHIAEQNGFSEPRKKFKGELREGHLQYGAIREKALILKPLTFMNDSGKSVGEAARFYKIEPEDVIVFYDELDLAPGKVRIKTGGGAAGHNGIRSIDAHLGNNFRRVRIGIGHPGAKSRVTGHVLGNFSKSDQDWLTPLLVAIAKSAPVLIEDDKRFVSDIALAINGGGAARAPKSKSPDQATSTSLTKSKLTKSKSGVEERSSPKGALRSDKNDETETSRNPFTDVLGKILHRKDEK